MQAAKSLGVSAGVAVLALLVTGCGPQMIAPPITVVPTHTPGVKYVIVRHALGDPFAGVGAFSKSSEYLLLCDGRAVDGMHCIIPPEVGAHVSVGPSVPLAPAPVPNLIGALTGGSEEHLSVDVPPPATVAPPAPALNIVVPVPPPSGPRVASPPPMKGGR